MSLVSSGFEMLISVVFGQVSTIEDAIIKLGLFTILFAVFTKGGKKIFPDNAAATNIIAAIISILAVRLMPYLWLYPLGKFMWVVAVLGLPYLAVDAIISEWSILKVALLAATYFGVYLIVASTGYWGFGMGMQFAKDLRTYWHVFRWQTIIFGSLAVVYIAFGMAKRM